MAHQPPWLLVRRLHCLLLLLLTRQGASRLTLSLSARLLGLWQPWRHGRRLLAGVFVLQHSHLPSVLKPTCGAGLISQSLVSIRVLVCVWLQARLGIGCPPALAID